MIVKGQQLQAAPTQLTRAELREHLTELWAQVFERELRAELEALPEATEERNRLAAIERAPAPLSEERP